MTAPNYEGFDSLEGFTPLQLQAYRQALLEKTKPQVEFIKKHVAGGHTLNVLEVGSGNGRLLIGLRLAGLLHDGLGLDMSRSRTIFALNWRNTLGMDSTSLDFYDVDVLEEVTLQDRGIADYSGHYDLVVCVTGCFQYFDVADAKRILKFMRDSAMYALFELYHRPTNPRSWHKLPDTDKFAYLLDEYTPDNPTKHTKTFIGRDGSVDERVEYLRYYSDIEFRRLLAEAGFTNLLWDVSDDTKRVVLVS